MWGLPAQQANQEHSRCMVEVLLPLTSGGPLQDLSKELRHQHPIHIRVPPSPTPLSGTATVVLPRILPALLLLLRDTPLRVVIIRSQLCPMLCILMFPTPRCLPVSHMGKCLPHRVLRLPGQLKIPTLAQAQLLPIHHLKIPIQAQLLPIHQLKIPTLAQAQLLPIHHDLHPHLHSSTTSHRVIQDTVLDRGQLLAFHPPKTISSETKWDPWLQPTTTQQIMKMSSPPSPAP